MSTRSNLSAGLAGSSNSKVNVNLNSAGGNKKQGIPPHSTDNWANRVIQEKSNGTAYGRNLIYTENQLGGVGAGRSMFKIGGKNRPDGVISRAPYSYGEKATDVTDGLTVNGELMVYGDISATGEIGATGDITTYGILKTSRIETPSSLSIGSLIGSGGTVTIGSTVSSTINNGTLTSSGLITANQGLTVIGTLTCDTISYNSITVNGDITTTSGNLIGPYQNTNVSASIDASGAITGTSLTCGDITCDTILSNGESISIGDTISTVTIPGDLSVTGTITGDLDLSGNDITTTGSITCGTLTATTNIIGPYKNTDATASIDESGAITCTSISTSGLMTASGLTVTGDLNISNISIDSTNTSVGYTSSLSGSYNSGFGSNSLYGNVGDNNVGVGYNSLQDNNGHYNTALGSNLLISNRGNNNIASGYQSLNSNTGDYNIGLGYNALHSNTGDYNIGIGYNTGGNNTYSNCTFIGVGASGATGDNQIIIGTSVDTIYIPGTLNSGTITYDSINVTGDITTSGNLIGAYKNADVATATIDILGNITCDTITANGLTVSGTLTCDTILSNDDSISIGDTISTVTIPGNLGVTGTITGGSLTCGSIDAINSTSSLDIGNNQTSGSINIGTGTRPANCDIFIGTTTTSDNNTITIGCSDSTNSAYTQTDLLGKVRLGTKNSPSITDVRFGIGTYIVSNNNNIGSVVFDPPMLHVPVVTATAIAGSANPLQSHIVYVSNITTSGFQFGICYIQKSDSDDSGNAVWPEDKTDVPKNFSYIAISSTSDIT